MGKLHHFLVVFLLHSELRWCYIVILTIMSLFKMFTLPWGILLRGMGLPSAIPSGLEIPTGRGRRSLNRRIAGLTPSAASSCARLRPKTKHSVWKESFLSWLKEQHVWAIISNFHFWGKTNCHFKGHLLFSGLDFSELCFIFVTFLINFRGLFLSLQSGPFHSPSEARDITCN